MVEAAVGIGNMTAQRPRPESRTNPSVEKKPGQPKHEIPVIPNLPPRENLLIWQERQKLDSVLKDPNVSTIILAAGTGTGKTRGGSQIALEALGTSGKMVVTENLRRAAEESAKVAAADLKVGLGDEVGVQNRYVHKVSEDTRLLFCPVQSLLIKMESDPLLSEYSLVAMDEVHKESKANELCMIQLRDIQAKRKAQGLPQLKLMFISATVDQEKIKTHFPDAVPVEIEGKTYPVDESFETQEIPPAQLPRRAAERIRTSIETGEKGNILAFLSGEREIEEAKSALDAMGLKDVEIIKYMSTQPKEEQERLFKESGKRKIVLATNAAQEGLTLDVNIVVDTGMHKHKVVDEISGREYLREEKAPQDHLTQRRGRVGRKESPFPGQKDKYYALFTKEDRAGRPEHETAEMQRTELMGEMLILLAQGHTDLHSFRFINDPPAGHIDSAVKRLEAIGAVEHGKLTDKGKFMATLQLKPNLSSMFVSSLEHGAAKQAGMLAAMLETYPRATEPRNGTPSPFAHPSSDALGLIQLLEEYRRAQPSQRREWAISRNLDYQKLRDASDLYDDLMRTVQEKRPDVKIDAPANREALDKSILEGFRDSLVQRSRDRDYFIEGIPGLQIAKESTIAKLKPGQFVTMDVQPHLKDGTIDFRLAKLNHVIPDELVRESVAKTPATDAATAPPAPSTPPPPEKEASVPVQEQAPAEPPAPPKPKTFGQRLKTWFDNSVFGKVFKWLFG